MVVFWSVELCWRMYEGVHFCACSVDVEVCYVEYFEFCHDWLGVRSWGEVFYESEDFLLGSDEWLNVCFSVVVCSPDGYILYEVGVYEAVV